LGLAAVDDPGTAAAVLRCTAERLAERGITVLLVDLTSSGALSAAPGLSPLSGHAPAGPLVYRPSGVPGLAHGPRRSGRRPAPDREELGELGACWEAADLVLALVEVDPGIDLDILQTWVNRVVPLVSAGRASRELLTTISGLVAESGLEMPFALLEGADRSDQSFGHPTPVTEDRDALAAVQSR
jgi:hypothetical protein